MLGEITHLQPIVDDLTVLTEDPHKLPAASEQVTEVELLRGIFCVSKETSKQLLKFNHSPIDHPAAVILPKATHMYQFAAEDSPTKTHYLLLFDRNDRTLLV